MVNQINKKLLLVVALVFVGFTCIGLFLWSDYRSFVSTPDILPPETATEVKFARYTRWQDLDYFYKLTAEKSVCVEFAKKLMRSHGFGDNIEMKEFVEFPIVGDFPNWFDVENIKSGDLLVGDGWAYAVVQNFENYSVMYYYLSY